MEKKKKKKKKKNYANTYDTCIESGVVAFSLKRTRVS
jgi:hypothetical protein